MAQEELAGTEMRDDLIQEGDEGGQVQGDGGMAVGGEDAAPADGGSGEAASASWLRDLTEEQAYGLFQMMRQMPEQLDRMSSRFDGRLGPYNERIAKLEKALSNRPQVDTARIEAAMREYDAGLADKVGPVLKGAFEQAPLDEAARSPVLEPIMSRLQDWVGEQIVAAMYTPDQVKGIIPPVDQANGKFVPETQTHRDFVDWLGREGYGQRESLYSYGPAYVQALNAFNTYLERRNQEKTRAAETKSKRLAGSRQPSSKGAAAPAKKLETFRDGFLDAFKE